MIQAAIETHTPITDFMEMTVMRFRDMWSVICDTVNKRNQEK